MEHHHHGSIKMNQIGLKFHQGIIIPLFINLSRDMAIWHRTQPLHNMVASINLDLLFLLPGIQFFIFSIFCFLKKVFQSLFNFFFFFLLLLYLSVNSLCLNIGISLILIYVILNVSIPCCLDHQCLWGKLKWYQMLSGLIAKNYAYV